MLNVLWWRGEGDSNVNRLLARIPQGPRKLRSDSYFMDGHTSVESGASSGRLSTSRNDEIIYQIWSLVVQNRHITIDNLWTKEDNHLFNTFHFDCGFGHMAGVCKICAKETSNGAK